MKFQQTITLADDTKLNGSAGLNDVAGELWIWLDEDTDMASAFRTFYDPSKTIRLRTELAEGVFQEFEGYTHMTLIREDAGKISLRLKKGGTNGSD